MTVTVKDLKALIENLPNETLVKYIDPNYGGWYCDDPKEYNFKMIDGAFCIQFPLVNDCNEE